MQLRHPIQPVRLWTRHTGVYRGTSLIRKRTLLGPVTRVKKRKKKKVWGVGRDHVLEVQHHRGVVRPEPEKESSLLTTYWCEFTSSSR